MIWLLHGNGRRWIFPARRDVKSRFERRDTNSPHSRRFDDEDVDAVIGINQLLFDWGGVDASKRVALSEQAGNRISLSLEIDRVAADIIDLGIKLSEQQQRFDLFTQYKKDLTPHIRRIEAGVAVGVLRLSDLRSIKVISSMPTLPSPLLNDRSRCSQTNWGNVSGWISKTWLVC